MLGNLNYSLLSCCLERCILGELVNCSLNVAVKWSQTRGVLLLIGSKPQSQVVMSWTHQSTCGPLISVRARATCRMGDSNPGMLVFSSRYPSSSFIKASALSLSPSKIWGSVPMTCISAASRMGTSCYGGIGAGCPPPPPPPPLPPPSSPPLPPLPPPGGAPGPVLRRAVAKAFLRQSSTPG